MAINVNTKDFEKCRPYYSKVDLIKTYKNGSKDYKVLCTCGKCGGTGFIHSSLDSGRCWKCNTTGKVTEVFHVTDTTSPVFTKEQVEEIFKKERAERVHDHFEKGYKPIDFKVASWASKVKGTYYRVVNESAKAILISTIDRYDSRTPEETWLPKSAITFLGYEVMPNEKTLLGLATLESLAIEHATDEFLIKAYETRDLVKNGKARWNLVSSKAATASEHRASILEYCQRHHAFYFELYKKVDDNWTLEYSNLY